MNPTGSGKLHHGGGVQAQKFINSGENLSQERFTKSRQRKHGRVVVAPFPSNNTYLG